MNSNFKIIFTTFLLFSVIPVFSQSGNIIYKGIFLRPAVNYDSNFSYELGLHKGNGWVGWDTFGSYGLSATYKPAEKAFGAKISGISTWFVLLGAEIEYRKYPNNQNFGLNLLFGWNFNTIFNDFSHLQLYYGRNLTFYSDITTKNPKHSVNLALVIPLKIDLK